MRIIINYSRPRLSDEDLDPLEMDEYDGTTDKQSDGWVPWDLDDLIDIRRIIDNRMPIKQAYVIDAFLNGLSYADIDVTEKYWRYHFDKAVQFIKEEMKL